MRSSGHYPKLAEFEARLRTLTDGASVLAELPSTLNEVFGGSHTAVYTLAERDGRLKLDELHVTGFERIAELREDFNAFLENAPTDWASFNPMRPEPGQRNQPMDMRDIERVTGESAFKPITGTLYRKHRLRIEEQTRLLVCEGASLLAWIGIYRAEAFTPDEKRALRGLVPSLCFRLDLERRLALVPLQAQLIDKALEAIAGAAYVLSGASQIAHANSRGRALLDKDDRDLRDALSRAVRDGGQGPGQHPGAEASSFEVARLRSPGMSDHFLVIDRSKAATSPVVSAASRWGLTARQHEVLLHLAAGQANKTIAAELGCAESTVEIHVTAILAKAGAESRSELIAKVYTAR